MTMHDIHTHLYWHTYDDDRDAVIERARAAGVDKLLVIGCTVEESQQCVTLSEQYHEIYASVGIHPQTFSEFGTGELASWTQQLKDLAKNKKVVAIGECGLEYYSHNEQQVVSSEHKTFQKQGFLAQIELAQELGLPLIIHCRASTGSDDAYRDLLEILKADSQGLEAIILHCYMGDTEVTREFLELPNVFFSFTANITYPVKKAVAGTKDDLSETVRRVPLERLFVETDCPFLSPQARRGERNEPANVVAVAERVAELQGVPHETVAHALDANFARVFPALDGK